MAQAKSPLIVVPSLFYGPLAAAGISGGKLDNSE
jgi:hypothetical protein